MSFRYYLYISTLLFAGITLYGCNDCDDCGPLEKEPSVALKFINQDSLKAVQESVLILESGIDDINLSLETINADLEFFSDSLQVINVLIAEGDQTLEATRNTIELKIDALQTTFTEFQNLRGVEEDKIVQLQLVQADIENGKVRIDSLLSKTNETTLTFGTDSLELFKFPLSVNLDSTSFEVFIDGNSYDLSLEYVRNLSEDEKSRIEMVISMIRVTNHTFIAAIPSCEVCNSNETSITVFF